MGQEGARRRKKGWSRTKGEQRTPWVPLPCHGWRWLWARSSLPESRNKSQLQVSLIQCCEAMGSFKQVTLAVISMATAHIPNCSFLCGRKHFSNWERQKWTVVSLSYDPSSLANHVLSLNITVSWGNRSQKKRFQWLYLQTSVQNTFYKVEAWSCFSFRFKQSSMSLNVSPFF